MSLSNLRVGLRLSLGFAALLLLVLAMGLYAISRVGHVQSSVNELATHSLPSTQRLGDMDDALNAMRRAELQMLLSGEAQTLSEEGARIDKQWTILATLMQAYERMPASPERARQFRELQATVEAYRQAQARVIALVREGKQAEAVALMRGDERKVFRAADETKARLDKLNDEEAASVSEDAAANYQEVLIGIWVMVAAAMALGVVIAWILTRSLTVPLYFAATTAHRIAGGDLSGEVSSTRGDELGDLLRALARMQEALNLSIGDVRHSAENIASASAEVSSGGHDLSARTEEAAASLEQTAAAMQQVGQSAQASAESTRQAHQLAGHAASVASKGGEVVARVVSTMDGIQASSRKIGDIIGVIDGIAFQTNILALNAAVEAARAGEQGRGFAVVAGEVRTLAKRSAQAAREIKTLISGSVDQVENGARLVGQAGNTMNEVVSAVRRVSALIGEVSTAIQNQTKSLGEVGSAIGQLDVVTLQNAALVEESAAASESLRDQATRLTEVVGRFRLKAA